MTKNTDLVDSVLTLMFLLIMSSFFLAFILSYDYQLFLTKKDKKLQKSA